MILFLENVFIIIIIAAPLLIVEILRSHSSWIEEHHEALSFVLWILALILVYFWLLPSLGLETNSNFFNK